MSFELFLEFVAFHSGVPVKYVSAIEGSPMRAIELLWPVNAPLRQPGIAELLSANPYDASGEAEFDLALEQWANAPETSLSTTTVAAATVWDERLRQTMLMLTDNFAAGLPTILPPSHLQEGIQTVALALLWLHKSDLPYPIGYRGLAG